MSARGYEAPVGEIETQLARIWAELLKVERVGRHDNFFELGGHSLLAVRVISRLRQALGVEVRVGRSVRASGPGGFRADGRARRADRAAADHAGRIAASRCRSRLRSSGCGSWRRLEGASEAYHIAGGLRLKGELDREALRRALDRIVARHEALRTTFVAGGRAAGAAHRGRRRAAFSWWSTTCAADARRGGGTASGWSRAGGARSRSIWKRGPLIRGRLVRLGEDEHVLLMTMHHIVSDGWSMGVLINELSALYGAFVRGRSRPAAGAGDAVCGLCGVAAAVDGGRGAGAAGGVLEESAGGSAGAAGVADRPAAAGAAGLCGRGCVELELDEELTRGAEGAEPAARDDAVHDAAGGLGGVAGAAVAGRRTW